MYILICYLKHKIIQIIMTYRYLLCGFILFLSMITYPGKIQNDCVSVPPGGISGFWYSISKIRYFETKEYYCASSGCLAVVSSELKLNDIYNIAKISRDNFNSIEHIKNNFIDLIVKKITVVPNVTMVTMSKFGTCIERKPRNKHALKTLLIKTTDVPFLIKNVNREMDGGLCYYYMNTCKFNINLPLNYRFLSNLFNQYISDEDLAYFYNYI